MATVTSNSKIFTENRTRHCFFFPLAFAAQQYAYSLHVAGGEADVWSSAKFTRFIEPKALEDA